MLGATTSLGVILATILVGQFPCLQRRGVLSYLGTLVLGVSLALFGLPITRTNPAGIASLASITYGFGMGFSGLLWTTIMQERVPQEKLGRVSSIEMLCGFSLIPVGLAIGGLTTDHIGASNVFVVCGVINVILALAALSTKDIRRLS